MAEFKLFNAPIMGTIIVDKENKKLYLFNQNRTKYMIVPTTEMEEVAQSYKHCNVLNKPYNVLIYEQVFKNRSHGFKVTKILTNEELNNYLSDKELVK